MKSEKQSEKSKITFVDILLRESMLEHVYLCLLSCFYVVVTGLKILTPAGIKPSTEQRLHSIFD